MLHEIEHWVQSFAPSDAGTHDWFHVDRVRKMSLRLAAREKADARTVELCALLHEVGDVKLTPGTQGEARSTVHTLLKRLECPAPIIVSVGGFVESVGFRRSTEQDRTQWPIEWKVVQDADYIDAMGAVGIARAFWFGGFRGESIYSANRLPELSQWNMDLSAVDCTISHFSKKLFALRSYMLTNSGRVVAEARHHEMVEFMQRFIQEWNCDEE